MSAAPPLKKHILTHQQPVMYPYYAVMRAKVLAYPHVVTHPEMLSVADIRPLLHIDRCAALGKQMLRAAVTEPVGDFAQYGQRGLRQTAGNGVIDYQPECSHRSARMGL